MHPKLLKYLRLAQFTSCAINGNDLENRRLLSKEQLESVIKQRAVSKWQALAEAQKELERELAEIRIYEEFGINRFLPTYPLGWHKRWNRYPLFGLFDQGSDVCYQAISGSLGDYKVSPEWTEEVPGFFCKCNLLKRKLFLWESYRVALSAGFAGIPSLAINRQLEQITKAKVFDHIGFIVSVKKWMFKRDLFDIVCTKERPDADALIVGWNAGLDRFYLIDSYEHTSVRAEIQELLDTEDDSVEKRKNEDLFTASDGSKLEVIDAAN